MSGFQALEPQPTAEAVLHTTAGDLRLELFAKQTPLASRNFLQLCLDGYYNDTIFHRLVPGFIVQGGDPTGTGSGGESSFNGDPFADEFHSRLKFNRRGLLGMANSGTKNDNGSQFFLTLGETPELTGKNTMFGRVSAEGDTIYNLMKIAEGEVVEGTDTPQFPFKVSGAEILLNPFEDMVKRITEAPRTVTKKESGQVKKKAKRKAGKNVLSFGGDDEDEGLDAAPAVKKPKFNPMLVSADDMEPAKQAQAPATQVTAHAREKSPAAARAKEESAPNSRPTQSEPPTGFAAPRRRERSPSTQSSDGSDEDEESERQSQAFIDRTNEEIAKLKASMKRTVPTAPASAKPKTGLEALIPATATKGRKRRAAGATGGKDEEAALDFLNAFRAKLDAAPSESNSDPRETDGETNGKATNGIAEDPSKAAGADEEAALCDLHFIANCQSCSKWDEDGHNEDDDADRGWMSHALSFAKDRLGKDLEWKRKNEEELLVIDPREKARELKEERKNNRPRDERRR